MNNQSQFQSHLSPDFFNSTEYFPTQETAMTAWLMTCGFPIESVSKKGVDFIFIFKKCPELDKAILQWKMNNAPGNCCLYENNRKTLIKIIKENNLGR